MTLTAKHHTVIATVLIITVAYLTRLGGVEIQPWDEGLYAVRGESAMKYGDVWDQTSHAIGGLYSSIPAPMTSWQVALGMSVFGRSALGVRIVGVVEAGLALALLYLILQRLVPHRMALLGVVFMGTSLHWVVYARQAMSEVPLMTFTLLALWASFRLREELQVNPNWRRPEVLLNVLLFGAGLGCSMLTKLVVGALPIWFLLTLLFSKPTRIAGLLGVAVGLMIALPWYISMTVAHGQPFIDALTLKHVTTVVEGNSQKLGMLYYFNQFFIAQPILLLAFVVHFRRMGAIVRSIFTRTPGNRNESWQEAIILTWFALAFIVLSLAPTKNPHYVVTLIPPGIIVAACSFERLLEQSNRRFLLLILIALVGAAVWSAIPGVRLWLKQRPLTILPYLAGFALVCVLPFVLKREWVDEVFVRAYRPVLWGVLISTCFTSARIIYTGYEGFIHGGREVAEQLQSSGAHSFAYLYHKRNEADSLNPQLAWYTGDWMLHRDPDYSYMPAAMLEDSASIDVAAVVATSGQPYVVYYHPGMPEAERTRVYAVLSTGYRVKWAGEQYTLLAR